MKLLTITSCTFLVIASTAFAGGTDTAAPVAKNAKNAAVDRKSYAAEVTATQLHFRAGPSASYQSVVMAKRGTRVIVRESTATGWATIEIPGGYPAWVGAKYIQQDGRVSGGVGSGVVTANTLLVRPRPSTSYHQLTQRLARGETVKVLGTKQVGDTTWLRIQTPQRIPLFCSARFLNKVGPASMATAPIETNSTARTATVSNKTAAADARFIKIEKSALRDIHGAKTRGDLAAVKLTLATVNGSDLSLANQRRHLDLERKLLRRNRELVVSDVEAQQQTVLADLEKQIAEIEAKYQQRINDLHSEAKAAKTGKRGRYITTGILEYKPELFGRAPSFRVTEGGKLRHYVIAPAYDLHQYVGKRIGVVGLLDRESGTGYFTVMGKRIEIIADR